MKKFGDIENGITTYVNDGALVISIPINVLKTSFEYLPDYEEAIIKPKKENKFAELIAEHLQELEIILVSRSN
jgi:hypothetical protein